MKNDRFKNMVLWILSIIPLLVTIAIYPNLSEKIPMHWNVAGQVDRFGDKFPAAFILPGVTILILALLTFIPKIDPKRKNYEVFGKTYYWIRLCFVVVFGVINIITILVAVGFSFIKVDMVVKLLVGVLILVLGNQMPKLKHNYFVGIKTPWTLASEEVWYVTHRIAGPVWFAAGVVMIVFAFIPGVVGAMVYMGVVLLAAVIPIVYSYYAFKKLQNA